MEGQNDTKHTLSNNVRNGQFQSWRVERSQWYLPSLKLRGKNVVPPLTKNDLFRHEVDYV